MPNQLKIVIAADHAGFELKETLKKMLEKAGYQVTDLGPDSTDSVDYPDYAHPLADKVEQGEADFGVLMCGSANGVAMTANKHPNIRAAITWREDIAKLARQHNNANVICLPARFVKAELAEKMVQTFLTTEFEGGRHQRRTNKIPLKSKEKV